MIGRNISLHGLTVATYGYSFKNTAANLLTLECPSQGGADAKIVTSCSY